MTAEQYGAICDVSNANYQRMPPEFPGLHTSDEARAATNRILEILGLEVR